MTSAVFGLLLAALIAGFVAAHAGIIVGSGWLFVAGVVVIVGAWLGIRYAVVNARWL